MTCRSAPHSSYLELLARTDSFVPPFPSPGGGWQPRARGCSRLVSSIRPRHSSCTHLSAQTRGFAQQSGTTSSARPTSTMRTCRCGKAPWPITCAPLGLHALHSRATTTVPAMCLAWYTTNSPELLAKHDGPCRTRIMSSKRETSRALFLGVLRRHYPGTLQCREEKVQ